MLSAKFGFVIITSSAFSAAILFEAMKRLAPPARKQHRYNAGQGQEIRFTEAPAQIWQAAVGRVRARTTSHEVLEAFPGDPRVGNVQHDDASLIAPFLNSA